MRNGFSPEEKDGRQGGMDRKKGEKIQKRGKRETAWGRPT